MRKSGRRARADARQACADQTLHPRALACRPFCRRTCHQKQLVGQGLGVRAKRGTGRGRAGACAVQALLACKCMRRRRGTFVLGAGLR